MTDHLSLKAAQNHGLRTQAVEPQYLGSVAPKSSIQKLGLKADVSAWSLSAVWASHSLWAQVQSMGLAQL